MTLEEQTSSNAVASAPSAPETNRGQAGVGESRSSAVGARALSAKGLLLQAAVFAAATAAVMLACSLLGPVPFTVPGVWWAHIKHLVAAAAVGMALATAGLALQGLLRNPLAEPYILGISSGAGVGVLLGLALATKMILPALLSTPVLALTGALATSAVVYGIAQRRGRLDPYVLLLSGVIVNAFNGAVMLAIYLLVPPQVIANFTIWAMGGVSEQVYMTSPSMLTLCIAAVLAGCGLLLARGGALNALGLGDEVAQSAGVHVHYLRVEVFVVVSLVTAASVALAGPIGFVGLIVPHICRSLFGPDHRRLALVSAFGGAIFLMIGETLCSLMGEHLMLGEHMRLGKVPVGILTALCGGPFFIFLLRRRRQT